MREKLPLPLPQTLSALLFSTVTPEVCECVCGGVGLRDKGMIRSLAEREDFHEGSSTEKDGHLVCCSLSPPPPSVPLSLLPALTYPTSGPRRGVGLWGRKERRVGSLRERKNLLLEGPEGERESICRGP
jgi:hypothetical protein